MNDAIIDIETNNVAVDPFWQVAINIFHPWFDQVAAHSFYMNTAQFFNHAIELG